MTATEKSILIALGSNLSHPDWGAPPLILAAAINFLEKAEIYTRAHSSIWSSAAWPDPRDPRYANAVIAVETPLPSDQLLDRLHAIEAAFGRDRSAVNAPRTLDLDLLAYGREVRAGPRAPILPHPRLQERGFVLRPLAEICPSWRHPVSGQGVAALLAALDPADDCRLWSAA
ncbi:2-amino-4-hydroxy-6-hydroxymethyldihydropteridine diphosphokinase [Elstera cyanobacteriorum]|uniref:2-amino-4-hydroxy-6- hydroxymethyldihydropteridine diphosphokinase n=1 Tax=Elstera cyanobacteriorum TaxID=2022747 RepID=UPI002356B4B6|nr:2-amino-4-hydroxy-6-hydroxymethyldihydropteridine diphosphokinase [Elstera cyanobacteriorum]MCK6443568.1 2-amino-4-hydroxy-6-hydroxymethyldihydropteridine diphosphokinase [Elstera cyanobacteriorum]